MWETPTGVFQGLWQAQNFPSIYPLGFLPLIEPRVTDQSLTGGVRGELATWFYDASVGYGRNKFAFYVSDSLNTSLGPINNFNIDIEDRVVFSGNFTGARVLPLIQPFGATGARFFTNAIDTETKGYDVVVNYQRGLAGWGRLDASAAYSRNETEIVGEVATPQILAELSEVLFDRIERRRVECGQPKDNIRLMQSWTMGQLTTTLRESRYGEFCSFTILPIDDQIYGATWVNDIDIAYKWGRYTASLGVENVFDAFPDKNFPGTPQGNFGIFTYPSQSPFGMNGRFVYVRMGVRL